ncbi:MAG: helix-turn-helix domain-containing protein [Streptococcaceae bacterium]|jgi:phage repressor protein C with HTH and peptisase S24 domain|nr:helix-turn-helix domain-containing protein [Streptococcaceae bacterium]
MVNETTNEIFAENLKSLLKEQKLTQRSLALQMGVTTSNIQWWLKGKYKPKGDKLELLADILNVSSADLLDGNNSVIKETTKTMQILTSSRQRSVLSYSKHLLTEQERAARYRLKQSETIIHLTDYVEKTEYYDVDYVYEAAAGTGYDLSENNQNMSNIAGTVELPSEAIPNNYDDAILVNGVSMEPVFRPGDIAYGFRASRFTSDGIYSFTIDSDSYIKYISSLGDHKYLVHSFNEDKENWGDWTITKEDDLRVYYKIIEPKHRGEHYNEY